MLKGKKILLGITGSIAAYKTAILVRNLIKAGAEVRIIMTPSAIEFVAPLTLSTLSKNEVLYTNAEQGSWANHVMLGRWANLMVIAPLTCNTLAKMSNGICDNLLMAVYLSATCPVVVAPAMDEDMWLHPSTSFNLKKIQSYGNHLIPVEHGELASGLIGPGRMAEPEKIVDWIHLFFKKSNQLAEKKVLITAGPTHESIDPVRFISNHSTGKMGIALANECIQRGAAVTLICGPITIPIPDKVKHIPVVTAAEMYEFSMLEFENADIAVLSAAVADYTVKNPAEYKIKKTESCLTLELEKTRDILKSLGERKKENQLLIGFALETNNEEANATSKLISKNADYIILNSMNDKGAGFGKDTNKITIFAKNGNAISFETKSKSEVANDIIDTILKNN